jgi:hypothetical protein
MNPKHLLLCCLTLLATLSAQPDEPAKPVEIRLEHHRFTPQAVTLPANRPLQIKIINLSAERIEFESFSLNRERVVEPGKSVTIHLPALRPGNYDFRDDFHDDVPAGIITAK